jgi:hypothetical protein
LYFGQTKSQSWADGDLGSPEPDRPQGRKGTGTMTAIATPPIRAELTGSNRAEALGVSVRGGYAPLCQLCRRLIRAGINPDLPVEAYRNGVLALRARSLLVAAQLTVEDCQDGRPRFRPYRARSSGVAPPIAQNEPALPGQPPDRKNAPAGRRRTWRPYCGLRLREELRS